MNETERKIKKKKKKKNKKEDIRGRDDPPDNLNGPGCWMGFAVGYAEQTPTAG